MPPPGERNVAPTEVMSRIENFIEAPCTSELRIASQLGSGGRSWSNAMCSNRSTL